MTLELVRPIVTFGMLMCSFVAGCAWYGRTDGGRDGSAPVWGGLAFVLLLAGVGYGALWMLMGPIR